MTFTVGFHEDKRGYSTYVPDGFRIMYVNHFRLFADAVKDIRQRLAEHSATVSASRSP